MANTRTQRSKYGSLSKWFRTAESQGEFIGIRFGRLVANRSDVEWHYYPHTLYDGIGAFAEILRKSGVELSRLPQIKYYPAYSPLVAAAKHWPRYVKPRRPVEWRSMDRIPTPTGTAPAAIAWHVFDETATQQMRLRSRENGYTVNTLLLKALNDALRGYLKYPEVDIPWMVPVNMRGGVNQYRDTDNHSSYVAIRIAADESAFCIHRRILLALSRGEHWGNWHAFKLGRCLTEGIRAFLVARGLCISQSSIGAFSNLGEWDPDKRITQRQAVGDWLFAPPALRSQKLAAGCVSFQGRLSLTIQAHPELTTSPADAQSWMTDWVAEILRAIPELHAPTSNSWNLADQQSDSDLGEPLSASSGIY